jgi:hypothetical protein
LPKGKSGKWILSLFGLSIWHFKFSHSMRQSFVAGDLVMRSQFVTGCLPESRSHFAILKNGEKWFGRSPSSVTRNIAP